MVFNNGYQTGYRQGYAPAPAAGPNELPRMAAQTTAENPWPVSMVSQKFHSAVERWPAVWMEGQIIEINTRRSGSAYLTLRDNDQDVSMSVLGFGAFAQMARDYKQGDRVVVHGKADLYVKSTRLSLRADMIKRVGAGNLQEQINQLRMRLKGEGLFDESRKVALPEFPKNIGLICAPQARAEGDVVMNVNLRWPGVRFTIVHAHVQGEQCPPDIVSAIQQLDADPNVDVIIVARGGGSFEDLMGFSDERVVRATAACATPIISAIGHEDDWTLIDLAADVRASTPTDAAKRVVPDVREQQQLITEGINRMRTFIANRAGNEERLVEGYANRPSLTQTLTMLIPHERDIADAVSAMRNGLRRIVDEEQMQVERLAATLRALSPQSTLDRGYAVLQNADGAIIDDASQVQVGDELTLTLRRGKVVSQAQAVYDE